MTQTTPLIINDTALKSVKFKYYWLFVLLTLTFLMIGLGGLTRLTESGLSMVDWRLFMGIFPPTDPATWQKTFENYQQYKEYQLLYPNMTLDRFKFIFALEYAHRMLGRFIGLVTLLPLGYLVLRQQVQRKEAFVLGCLFILVATQGGIGWIMVKSGLNDHPRIGHLHLALHFFTALLFIGATLSLGLIYRTQSNLAKIQEKSPPPPQKTHFPIKNNHAARTLSTPLLSVVTLLFLLQTFYGTAMAGLEAGYVSQTYPQMLGHLVPTYALQQAFTTHGALSLINHSTWVHFIHRHLGIVTTLVTLFFVAFTLYQPAHPAPNAASSPPQPTHASNKFFRNALYTLGLVTLLQPLTGILTVVLNVPISLALLHQLLAIVFFMSLITLFYCKFSK